MTDIPVPEGKADAAAADRRAIEAAKQKETREGILRRHFVTHGAPHMAPGASEG